MRQPMLDDLLDKTKSKYGLVVLSAKRARQITETGMGLLGDNSTKPVTIALHEISEGRVFPKT